MRPLDPLAALACSFLLACSSASPSSPQAGPAAPRPSDPAPATKPLRSFTSGHAAEVTQLEITRDRQKIASAASDGSVRVRRGAEHDYQPLSEFSLPGERIHGIRFSASGRYLAVSSERRLLVRDLDAGSTLFDYERGEELHLASLDYSEGLGLLAATHSDGHVDVIDGQGQRRCRIEQRGRLTSAAFLPGSEQLLVAELEAGVHFHATTGPCRVQRSLPLSMTASVDALWPYADGSLFLVGGVGMVRLVHVETGHVLRTVTTPDVAAAVPARLRMFGDGLIYSPAVVSRDLERPEAADWRAYSWSFSITKESAYAAFADAGPRVFVAPERLLEARGGDLAEAHALPPPSPFEVVPQRSASTENDLLLRQLAVSADGRFAAIATATGVEAWDLRTAELLAHLPVVAESSFESSSLHFFEPTGLLGVRSPAQVSFFTTRNWNLVSRDEAPGQGGATEFLSAYSSIGLRPRDGASAYYMAGGRKVLMDAQQVHALRAWSASRGARMVRQQKDHLVFFADGADWVNVRRVPFDGVPIQAALSNEGELFVVVELLAGPQQGRRLRAYDTRRGVELSGDFGGVDAGEVQSLAITDHYVVLDLVDKTVRLDRGSLSRARELAVPRRSSGAAMVGLPDSDAILRAEGGSLRIIDVEADHLVRDLAAPTLRIVDVLPDDSGQSAELSTSDGWVRGLDFRRAEPVAAIRRCDPGSVIARGAHASFCSAPGSISAHARGKTTRPDPYAVEDDNAGSIPGEAARSLSTSSDGKVLVALHWDRLEVRDGAGRLVARKTQRELGGGGAPLGSVAVSPDGRRVALARPSLSSSASPQVPGVSLLSGKDLSFERALDVEGGAGLRFSPDGSKLAVANERGVFVYDSGSGAWIGSRTTLPRWAVDVDWSSAGDELWVGYGVGELHRVDAASLAVKGIWQLGDGIERVRATSSGRVWTWGNDQIHIVDPALPEVAAHVSLTKSAGFLARTDRGDYWASREGLRLIRYRYGSEALSFDQLDPYFNRPDALLERLGLRGAPHFEELRRARLLRARRMGLRTDARPRFDDAPWIELGPVPRQVDAPFVELDLKVAEHAVGLRSLHVWIDGVPYPDSRGTPLHGRREYSGRVQVPVLAEGSWIEVSVSDERGVESLRQRAQLDRSTRPTRGKLLVLAVAVGDYGDPKLDLELTTKDARDIAATFQATGGRYSAVEARVLLDAQAHRDRIVREGRAFLAQSQPEDQVVVFFAGHGLRDAEERFYFGAFGIDPQHPEQKGLPMEQIEGLVDGIPAQRRLVLIDSCFSGLIDELPERASVVQPGVRAGKSRALVLEDDPQQISRARRDFHAALDAGLADLRRGSGAVVLAAAAGREFALESREWNNGVFTASILESLRSTKGDSDGDGVLSVAEIQRYVAARVRSLTAEAQTPIARQENLTGSFLIGNSRPLAPLPFDVRGGQRVEARSDNISRFHPGELRAVSPDTCGLVVHQRGSLRLLGPHFETKAEWPLGDHRPGVVATNDDGLTIVGSSGQDYLLFEPGRAQPRQLGLVAAPSPSLLASKDRFVLEGKGGIHFLSSSGAALSGPFEVPSEFPAVRPRQLLASGEVLLSQGARLAPDGRLLPPPRAWDASRQDARVVLSPAGDRWARLDGRQIVVLDAHTGRETRRLTSEGEPTALAIDPTGQLLVVARRDNVVELWSSKDGQLLLTQRLELESPLGAGIGALFVSPAAERIIAVGQLVYLWERRSHACGSSPP